MLKPFIIAMIATVVSQSMLNATELYQFDFASDPLKQGWTVESKTDGSARTFNPAEGYYPSKGAKMQGPDVACAPTTRYYSIAFESKCDERSHYFLTFKRANGELIVADIYGSMDAGSDWVQHNHVFTSREGASSFQVGFQSSGQLDIRNLTVQTQTLQEALQINQSQYAPVPADLLKSIPTAHLPKLQQHLDNGTPCRIVMLGDSIINDTYNSVFQMYLDQQYPGNQVEIICSVRGSTGCWYYQEQDKFKEYVTDLHPDILLIGGISHRGDIDAVRNVVTMAKASGCEIALFSGPMAHDWRQPEDPSTALSAQSIDPARVSEVLGDSIRFESPLQQLAQEMDVDYFDLFSAWHTFLGASQQPWQWYHRDPVHANDRGKFVLGKFMQSYLIK